jgi:inorganic phosphate transporter, PiT family
MIYICYSCTIAFIFLLSFANGSNDVSKPIATLAGSGVTSMKKAIYWGVFCTLLGSLAGAIWGMALIKNLTEKLYLIDVSHTTASALAMIIAPFLWVIIASVKKLPVSTTHSILGSLIGVGVLTVGSEAIDWQYFLLKNILPLLTSPFIAIILVIALMRIINSDNHPIKRLTKYTVNALILYPKSIISSRLAIDTGATLEGGEPPTKIFDNLHILSSGILSFARGLNDTPKLIAVIMPYALLNDINSNVWLFYIAAIGMACGGLFMGKNVTRVLCCGITTMNHRQGFIANIISGFLVIIASRFGLPVSTTHVSSASIIGIGVGKDNDLQMKTVKHIIFAWVVTAPVTALFAITIYKLLEKFL